MPSATEQPATMGIGFASQPPVTTSYVGRSFDEDVQDVVFIGFGPASLAIAIALSDTIESDVTRSLLHGRPAKVRFLERQGQFSWHAGMLLPGAKMQISFVKDLATLRNARSWFTFLNYLQQHNRLVSFVNLSTFLPQRIEYEAYLRWCASHFNHVVDYSQNVEAIEVDEQDIATGAVGSFRVTATDRKTGIRRQLRAKKVVVAAGGKPNIPTPLQLNSTRIIHSSQYATDISRIFPPGSRPRRIAVVGAGQSAAEVFRDIPSRFPGTQSLLVLRGDALRPSDDSPFVNEIFNPERVDSFYSRHPSARAASIALNRPTNYGVVRLELLEEIYAQLYAYGIQYTSEDDWPHRILNNRTVVSAQALEINGEPSVELQLADTTLNQMSETLLVDLVVVATGYARNSHENMMESLRHLQPDIETEERRWAVDRNYQVQFRDNTVAPDAGIWLQGCNETTHGLSDSLLSILAVRGGEMVDSLFGSARKTMNGTKSESKMNGVTELNGKGEKNEEHVLNGFVGLNGSGTSDELNTPNGTSDMNGLVH